MKLIKIIVLLKFAISGSVINRKITKNRQTTETNILDRKIAIYSNSKNTNRAEIFSYGEWDDKAEPTFAPISGLTLKYYAPDNKTLMGGLSIVEILHLNMTQILQIGLITH